MVGRYDHGQRGGLGHLGGEEETLGIPAGIVHPAALVVIIRVLGPVGQRIGVVYRQAGMRIALTYQNLPGDRKTVRVRRPRLERLTVPALRCSVTSPVYQPIHQPIVIIPELALIPLIGKGRRPALHIWHRGIRAGAILKLGLEAKLAGKGCCLTSAPDGLARFKTGSQWKRDPALDIANPPAADIDRAP